MTGCQDATSAAPKIVLYYCNFSFPSRKCLIALYEKNVEFEAFHLNQTAGEQYQRWYLEMNPRGQVPVLKHGERVVTESARILEYIDLQFGTATQLFSIYSLLNSGQSRKINQVHVLFYCLN